MGQTLPRVPYDPLESRAMRESRVGSAFGRVALVHDFLLDVRGAERVFAALCELFPEADLFTAIYDPRGTEGRFEDRNIHTSFLQRLRPTARTFRPLLPFYPYAMESLDLGDYDLVVSSSSAWAHGVIARSRRCTSATATTRSATRGTSASARWPAMTRCAARRWASCSSAGASGTGSPPSASTPTSPTRTPPAGACAATSAASASVLHPPVETERFTPSERSATTTSCSRS